MTAVSSGGISQVITVNVVPTQIPITISAVTGGLATITSETFTFTSATTVAWDGITSSVISVSEDGHSIVVPVPGDLVNEAPVISGAVAGYMPTVALAAAAGTATISNAGPAGSATIAGAAEITLNFDELTIGDRGTIAGADVLGGGGPIVWYKLVVPEDRHLDITLDWVGGNDLDWWIGSCDLNTQNVYQGTSAHPEHNSFDAVAGTYCLAVIDYQTSGPPTSWELHIAP